MDHMDHIYHGEFVEPQITHERDLLHAKIHWLLIYREEEYEHLDSYFYSLLLYIASLNDLLDHPQSLIDVMVLLHEARIINRKAHDDFTRYRKLILDAHTKVDEWWEGGKAQK